MPFLLLILGFALFSTTNSQHFQHLSSVPVHTQYHRGGIVSGGNTLLLFRNVAIPQTTPQPLDDDIQGMFTDIFNWNKNLSNDPRFTSCPVPNISDIAAAIPKSGLYFGLNQQHRMAVMMLRKIITGGKSLKDIVCLAGALRDTPGINPNAWIRGVFASHLSNPGLFELEAPSLAQVMPHLFFSPEVIQSARDQGTSTSPDGRGCTLVDGTGGSDNGYENALWYFREDLGVNSFHLNWHLIYPINPESKADRQGELFYFSHHSHLARYFAERLANRLGPTRPLNLDYNVQVREEYNPHLDDTNSGNSWTPRRSGLVVQDTLFESPLNGGMPTIISVANQSILVQRVQDSILRGQLLLPGGRGSLLLDSRTGIDFLGDLIEATSFTINGDYYGSFGFHNEGHVLVGFIEDPQNITNRPPGVMAEVATAMRDPVFYRYHAFVDQSFNLHKELLLPYTPDGGEWPLKWDAVKIESLHVEQDDGSINQLSTFFSQTMYELGRGLDFQGSGIEGNIQACVSHLDHNPFTYKIYVHAQSASVATVRIFMAPSLNENGVRFTLVEQRNHFFMMDLFTVSLQPGLNLINRPSTQSSLTTSGRNGSQFCGCGWPHHMLVPRGTEEGMGFDLFVMLTNGDQDFVASTASGGNQNQNTAGQRQQQCGPAPIYCGRMNDTYPDARPMGYPWDRLPYTATNLDEYAHGIPNMANIEIKITHVGERTPIQTPIILTAGRQEIRQFSPQLLRTPGTNNSAQGGPDQQFYGHSLFRRPNRFSSLRNPNPSSSKSSHYFSNSYMQYFYTV